jgi:uncharacterized protein YkwD
MNMLKNFKVKPDLFSLLIFGVLTACSQASEPTVSPTTVLDLTNESAAESTAVVTSEPEVIIVTSEVIVDKITVQNVDETEEGIQVIVQGYTSNTCTEVDEVTISKDGDTFNLTFQTSMLTEQECKEATVPFEEAVMLDAQGLPAGTYAIISGVIEYFEIGSDTSVKGSDESGEVVTDEAGTSPQDDASTEETPDDTGPRECEDYASFLADVTYPDNTEVEAGEVFTKTWEIKNSGTCSWGEGYEMVVVSGPFPGALPLDDPFPEVLPSGSVELSVVITAPLTADIHKGAWVIQRPEGDKVQIQEGDVFDLWAIVIVSGESAVSLGGGETREIKDGVVCAESNKNYENQILQLINGAREDKELPAYVLQPQLTNAARKLTNDMACNDFVSQTGTDGADWYGRITTEGYSYSDSAEIIFSGLAGLPEIAYNWWEENISLDGNILNSDFTQIGVAYAINPQTGASYYSVVFASPGTQ